MQKRFIRKLKRLLKRCKEEESELIFFDPAHQVHNSSNGYAWQFKGRKGTKRIKSNTGRRRINIIGGVSAITKQVTTVITEDNCDKTTITAFMKKLSKQYQKSKKVYVILDNASYNRSREVKKEANESNIKLVYLPAYCPNLNLIERLWKFFKKKVIENKYYEEFADFEKAIITFFENIHEELNSLNTLLNFKFGIIKAK